jgi:uncharacterized protein (DUF433 family)
MENLFQRITLNPAVCRGRPTIRNMRFTVAQLLELLAGGMSVADVPDDYPFLEMEDVQACLAYAARVSQGQTVFPEPLKCACSGGLKWRPQPAIPSGSAANEIL